MPGAVAAVFAATLSRLAGARAGFDEGLVAGAVVGFGFHLSVLTTR